MENQNKPRFGMKEAVYATLAVTVLQLSLDVYDRYRDPPPTLDQQYAALVRANQSSWDTLVKIKGMTPPAVKNAK